ncbi:unnamed protein product [Urochloa humidicola]
MASSKLSLALFLPCRRAVRSGISRCRTCAGGHDLPLTLSPEAGSHELFGAGFVLRRGTHASFPVGSWHRGPAGSRRPAQRRRRRVVQHDLHPAGARHRHRRAARGPGPRRRPAAGTLPRRRPPRAGHRRCTRETAAGGDCRNVDELKVIYFDHQ